MSEFEQRRQAASQELSRPPAASQKVDALIVSSPANVRYLCGFSGSNGLILLTPNEAHFITDPRYAAETAATITCKSHIAKGPLAVEAAKIIKRKRFQRVGFEPAWMNMAEYQRLKKELPAGVTLHPVRPFLEDLRAVKSPEEIALIRRSVDANSEAYARTLKRIRPGLSELEIAAELEFQMKKLGCEKPAFDTIVAFGERAALPHAHPSMRRLAENELVLIDMGATLDGYTSDMTRMVFAGSPPRKVRDLYNAVAEAQQAGLDAVRPGIPVSKVDAAARSVLKSHKLEKEFVHSTGHGLGLEIHEAPRIGKPQKGAKKKDEMKLKAGMVITIEPGAYITGFGGVRIEDTVLVTETGCEVLTPTSKEFITVS